MTAPDVTVPTVVVGGVGAPRGSDYAVLGRQIRAAGLLARRPGAYAVHSGVTLAFYLATCAAVVWVGDSWYELILAAVLGAAFSVLLEFYRDEVAQAVQAAARTGRLGRAITRRQAWLFFPLLRRCGCHRRLGAGRSAFGRPLTW